MANLDLLIKNVSVVKHDQPEPLKVDIGIKDGKIASLNANTDPATAREVFDANGKTAFPGVVDGHQHWGIYNPLELDSASESKACAQGGVTTAITYMRTGQYYLNKGGSYLDFYPEVLAKSEGKAYVDYSYHLAPMSKQHLTEIPSLIEKYGVSSFKIFMFYGSHGLHGRSSDQNSFLMIPEGERYDVAHFEFVMRAIQAARLEMPQYANDISLSLHCETAEIMTAYTKLVEEAGTAKGLEAYHLSRPPHSEGLAIAIASYLAHETELPNINLLHLTSFKAVDAAIRMAKAFPHVNFRREVTIGHLLADINNSKGIGGKVNPPLRPKADVEALWQFLLNDEIDWVVSDHACCKTEMKFGTPKDDVFVAKSGFGGAEYLLAGLVSESKSRNLSYQKIAQLSSWNVAKRYGLHHKGAIEIGFDADIALVDPNVSYVVKAEDSLSAQEYTPFEGFELTARVTNTWLRGKEIFKDGNIVGSPAGQYQFRPTRK
jgi:allantoinase